MLTSDFRPEVEIWSYRVCTMKNVQYNPFNGRIAEIFIGTVRSLWSWLLGRYHVPQNVFLVFIRPGVDLTKPVPFNIQGLRELFIYVNY